MTKTTDHGAIIRRGLDFLNGIANKPEGSDSYGSLLTCCFALIGATSRDSNTRHLAKSRAHTLARRWKRQHEVIPTDATPDLLLDFVMVRYALSRLGVSDPALNAQIRSAVQRFSVQDLLGFDPLTEPPPSDLPYRCDCGMQNQRGRKFCKQCRQRLEIQTRYRVWMEALANTYVSERCGQILGVSYLDVLKWLPQMRPYPVLAGDDLDSLHDAIYAVTHVVYTLNDYGTYKLSPRWLPQEFTFLKSNVVGACEREDPEVLGELLDSLKAFGLATTHPLIRYGTEYLLADQNKDGSWGDPEEEDMSTRCHTTWTAIDGLRSYAWRGERLSVPAIQPMLGQWAQDRGERHQPDNRQVARKRQARQV